jgi:hypothetical protein
VQDFIADGLFGDHESQVKVIVEKIIYSKTLRWQHEAEYRLAIPLRKGERPWDVLPYHPEEITEIYLGLSMMKDDKDDIVSKAKARNPYISIFETDYDSNGMLTFSRV